MRFLVGAIALLAGTAVAQECNCDCVVDDCFSVVAGTSPFPAEATVADCRSFMWEVVTVAAETVTTTALVTETASSTTTDVRWTTITVNTESAPLQKRQATGVVTVPDYATGACPQSSDFSSACRCLGVTEGGTSYQHVQSTETVTVTSTVTTTEDVTLTTTSTESATATNLYFKIRAANVGSNGIRAGQYLYTLLESEGLGVNMPRLAFVSNAAQGVIFRAGPDNKITGGDGTPFAGDVTDDPSEQLYLKTPENAQVEYTCTLDPGTKGVSCTGSGSGGTYSYPAAWSNGRLWLYTSEAGIQGEDAALQAVGPLTLEAVPI
ncbi:hypothetical protein TWF718_002854 [Orbilia javanica]|uniref:Uncharacterized protein n=1 Tax=Orbilia javanica TaxID=47235 RepID=A0AAN8MJ11_9PEZI